MMSTAVVFAGLTAVGLVFTFKKLPKNVQEFMLKHYLFTEIVTTVSTIALMGTSMTGLLGAAMVGTVTTALLHVREQPDKYAYLHVLGDWIGEQSEKTSNSLNEWARRFQAERSARKLNLVNG